MKESVFEEIRQLEHKEELLRKLIINNDDWFSIFCVAVYPKDTDKSIIAEKVEQRKKAVLEKDANWFAIFLTDLFTLPIFSKMAELISVNRYAEFFDKYCPHDELFYKHMILCEFIYGSEKIEKAVISQDDQQWIDNFIKGQRMIDTTQRHKKPARRLRKKPLIVGIGSLAAAIVIAISLVFLIPLMFAPPPYEYPPPPHRRPVFSTRNLASQPDFPLVDLNAYLGQRLNVEFEECEVKHLMRYYDSHYMQNLYFNLEFACVDGILAGIMVIYTNEYYTPRERAFDSITEVRIDDFDVKYHSEYHKHNNIYMITYNARIEHSNGIIIYIEYRELSDTPNNSGFRNFIQQTLRIP